MAHCGFKNRQLKGMCVERDWTACSLNDNTLDSIVNIIGRTCLMSAEIFISIMKKIFIRTLKVARKVAMASIWVC